MPSKRITDRLVKELPTPPKGKQCNVRDDTVVGFAVRKTATGFTSFVFNYVANGVERRMTIGSPPSWSVAAAREQAKKLRRMVDCGSDPLMEKRHARDELVLAELWERYSEDILPRKAEHTQSNECSIWNRLILPSLGKKRLDEINGGDIDRLHNQISKKTPVQENRALASLQHVFSTAIRWRLINYNPISGVKRNSENGRERFLTDAEFERLLQVLNARAHTPSTLCIRFLLVTGARSGEAFRSTWDQFDLVSGIWIKPSSHTKQRRLHRIPLSGVSISILQQAEQLRRNDYVFPGRGDNHLTTLKTIFSSICVEADLENLRVHDLRHTFASYLVGKGTALTIIGRLLGQPLRFLLFSSH